MFFRNLAFGALIASTSLQASYICNSSGEERLSIKPNYQLQKNAPFSANNRAPSLSVFAFLSMLGACVSGPDPLKVTTPTSMTVSELRRIQKAESRVNQATLRHDHRSPKKSHKPSVKTLHQTR